MSDEKKCPTREVLEALKADKKKAVNTNQVITK